MQDSSKKSMQVKANAKINLALNVVERLNNGYHNIESIMVPIELSDLLDISVSERIEIVCDDKSIPCNEENIIYKAIRFMQKEYAVKESFKVLLKKNIPSMAGLGGGSGDGGAIIRFIKDYCHLDASLEEIAAKSVIVGADVPFCVLNKPMLIEGIGEKTTIVDLNLAYDVLLVKGQSGVSTKLAYQTLDLSKCAHPDCKAILEAFSVNDTVALQMLENSLEHSAMGLNGEISEIKKALHDFKFDKVLMSGSGACVFSLTKNAEILEKAYQFFKKKNYFVEKTKILLR